MELGELERTRSRFFDSKIKTLSQASRVGIEISLKHFDEFAKKNFDGIDTEGVISHLNSLPEKEKEDKLFQILQDWINYLDSKGITAIRTYFSGLNRYLRYHKIKLTKEDIKEEITFPRKIEEERYALTLEDIHKIFKVAKYKMQGIYLAMLTSGMRPSETFSLRKKHFKFLPENSKYMITIPAKATKLKRERSVFTSREVTPYIGKAIKGLNDNDLVWSKNEIAKNAVSNAGGVFSKYCEKVGLDERFETTGSHKVNLYCFRAYFFTKAARVHGEEYAHKLIGHAGYLSQYDRKTLEEKLEMYEELESELLVFDLTKKDEKIKKLTQANREIEKVKAQVLELVKTRKKEDRVSSDLVSFYETGDKNYLKNFPPEFFEYWRMWKALKASGKKIKSFSWPIDQIPDDIKQLIEV